MRHSMFVICVAFASIVHSTANAAELKVFASRAVWTVLMAIGPDFEKTSGYKLITTTGLSGNLCAGSIPVKRSTS